MRVCFDCQEEIPRETDHFDIEGEVYCTDCVKTEPYTAYQYFLNGEYMEDSEGNGNVEFIESFDDWYDPEEES